ncbi:MAG: M15 family metallopeptidase [Alphaproteobacteria bacterium]|nr:M15 family metallopeptidase [Alphaproteobacteria bacterium]
MGNFFTDVIAKDARFRSTDPVSDMALLEPTFRAQVAAIIEDAQAQGIALMAFETYRSQERQALLFKRGATKLMNVGVHHYGLAVDLVRKVNGQPSWDGDFRPLGMLAYKHKLIWGGDWGNATVPHSFQDNVHVQRCSLVNQNRLFGGTWYPDETYDPYDDAGTVRQPVA